MKKFLFSLSLIFTIILVEAQTKRYVKIANIKIPSKDAPSVIKRCPFNDTIFYIGSNADYDSGYFAVVGTKMLRKPKLLKFFYGEKDDSVKVEDIFFIDKTMYTIGDNGIHVFDITNPANPVLTSTIKRFKKGNITRKINGQAFAISGTTLYLSRGYFYSVDISNPNAATENDFLSYSGVDYHNMVLVDDNTVITSDGLRIIKVDVTNKMDVTKSTFITGGDANGVAYDSKTGVLYGIKGEFIGNATALIAKNVASGVRLDSIHSRELSTTTSMPMFNPRLKNDTLYVDQGDEILLFDVKTPSDIKFLQRINGFHYTSQRKFAENGNVAYVINAISGFDVYALTSTLGIDLTSINETETILEKRNFFTIYPNPTTGILHIKPNSESNIFSIKIYNSYGNVIYESTEFTSQMDISKWLKGIYYLQIKVNDSIYSEKIVKE